MTRVRSCSLGGGNHGEQKPPVDQATHREWTEPYEGQGGLTRERNHPPPPMQELKLVFVAAYKSVLNLQYVTKLLEKVRMERTKRFRLGRGCEG